MCKSKDLENRIRPHLGALSHLAFKNEDAYRLHDETEYNDDWLSVIMTPFEVDTHKISGSRALRRLPDKTQVMTHPINAHTRNRLLHSQETTNRAYSIARSLGLNAHLCWAAAFGHDIGHVAFGHRGEAFLGKMTGRRFRHEVFACVVLQQIERDGRGLNLTHQTLQAIRNHSRGAGDMKAVGRPEDRVVMYADKLAYTLADLSDLEHGRYPDRYLQDFPQIAEAASWLGHNHWERFMNCFAGIIEESAEAGNVSFQESTIAKNFAELRKRMYVFYHSFNPAHGDEPILEAVYKSLRDSDVDADPALIFALLNDEDVRRLGQILFNGRSVSRNDLVCLSVGDLLQTVEGKTIDIFDPKLQW